MLKRFFTSTTKLTTQSLVFSKLLPHASYYTFSTTKAKTGPIFLQYDSEENFEDILKARYAEKARTASIENNKEDPDPISPKQFQENLLKDIKTRSTQFIRTYSIYLGNKSPISEALAELTYITYLHMDNHMEFHWLFNLRQGSSPFPVMSLPESRRSLLDSFREKILYLTGNNHEGLSISQYVIILKCVEGTGQFNEYASVLLGLQRGLKKQGPKSVLRLKDYLYLLKICAHLLNDPSKHTQAILLYNLDYMSEQDSFFPKCSVYNIGEVIDYSEQILNVLIRTKSHQYLNKTIKNLEANLVDRLKANLNNFERPKISISNPSLLFKIISVFKKMALNTKELYELIELNLIKEIESAETFQLKTLLIGYRMLTTINHGDKLLERFWPNYKSGRITLDDLRNYEKNFMIDFLQSVAHKEISTLYSQLNFKKAGEFSYLEKSELEKNLRETPFLKDNIKIYDLMLNQVLDEDSFRDVLDNQSFTLKNKLFQVFFWLEHSYRSSEVDLDKYNGIVQRLEIILKVINKPKHNKYKQNIGKIEGSNTGNEFIADVTSILTSEGYEIVKEFPLLIKSCDIAIPEKKVIFELDGSFHFWMDDFETSFVSNQFRNLYIILNKWKLVELNFVKWEKARVNKETKEIILQQLKAFEDNPDWILIDY